MKAKNKEVKIKANVVEIDRSGVMPIHLDGCELLDSEIEQAAIQIGRQDLLQDLKDFEETLPPVDVKEDQKSALDLMDEFEEREGPRLFNYGEGHKEKIMESIKPKWLGAKPSKSVVEKTFDLSDEIVKHQERQIQAMFGIPSDSATIMLSKKELMLIRVDILHVLDHVALSETEQDKRNQLFSKIQEAIVKIDQTAP